VTPALACFFVLATGLAWAPPVLAQEEGANDAASTTARAHYNAGTKAFSDRRYVEAALNFEAAAAEKASPVALYTAALSWEQANVPERAADDYTRALAVPGLPADKTGMARERLSSLESVLGVLTVVGTDGTRVQLDANTELAVPATLHAAAGVHSLSARAAGRPIERRPVVLERGKTTKLDLVAEPAPPSTGDAKKEPPPPPPPLPPPPPPADSGGFRRAVGFTAIGVGGAMLLSGVVLGSEAIGARDTYRGAPTQFAYDHASELQMWTDVAFIAGAVVAAGGVVLVVWPSSKANVEPAARTEGVSLVPLPGGLLLKGAF